LSFGFWLLAFGFWLLAFGFRLSSFVFRLSLDFPSVEAFCHQLRSATKTRDFQIGIEKKCELSQTFSLRHNRWDTQGRGKELTKYNTGFFSL
jgi:hypothetical protein